MKASLSTVLEHELSIRLLEPKILRLVTNEWRTTLHDVLPLTLLRISYHWSFFVPIVF